ncbi:MAG: DUF1439 domain-containing protein [Gammaproteobacteria bacterium]|nr:DUF1439 domain-containing protein [Gammaproteobacteria bacterium]
MTKKIQFNLISLLMFMNIATGAYAFSNAIYLSEAQIQQRVDSAFPQSIGTTTLGAQFHTPKVHLSKNENRVTLEVMVKLLTPSSSQQAAKLFVSGTPYYVPEQAEFRLNSLNVDALDIKHLSANEAIQIQIFANLALTEVMLDIPIYTLNDKDLREKIAKKRLKSARVVDGQLELEMSLD